MSQQKYNNQIITEYLLGSLSEAEAEQFDELSFTNDEFAHHLKAAENDLIDAYVQGELGGAKLEKFKSHYLATPYRREKVNFARSLQAFAEKANGAENEKNEQAISAVEFGDTPQRTGFFSFLNVFGSARPSLSWALAGVALAFLLIGGWFFLDNRRLQNQVNNELAQRDELLRRELELQRQIEEKKSAESAAELELARLSEERRRLEQELAEKRAHEEKLLAEIEQQKRRADRRLDDSPKTSPQTRQLSIASFVLSPPVRGSGQLQTLAVPAQTDVISMRLELETEDFSSYQAVLRGAADNRVLWRSGANLKAKKRMLGVQFPARLLKSQTYLLTISGANANGVAEIIGDYSFKVVR